MKSFIRDNFRTMNPICSHVIKTAKYKLPCSERKRISAIKYRICFQMSVHNYRKMNRRLLQGIPLLLICDAGEEKIRFIRFTHFHVRTISSSLQCSQISPQYMYISVHNTVLWLRRKATVLPRETVYRYLRPLISDQSSLSV